MLDTQQYQRILIAIDGSESAEKAFNTAIKIAKINESELIIAHVFDMNAYALGMVDINRGKMENILKEYKLKAEEYKIKKVQTILAEGTPKIVLAKEMPNEYYVDLIVTGKTGLNVVERWMLGSVSEYIIRNAPCDVLIVRNFEPIMENS